jgi:hypothetical protein
MSRGASAQCEVGHGMRPTLTDGHAMTLQGDHLTGSHESSEKRNKGVVRLLPRGQETIRRPTRRGDPLD